jgi:iron complex transport system ATP-binding protein
VLVAEGVSFGYEARTRVVRDLSVAVARGAAVGVLGPNGAGKTTLLRLLAGTLRPTGGRVTLEGRDLARLPRTVVARHLAVVPQETHLLFDYTVLEVVLMGRYPHLGPFELEGPRDLAIARASLAATGTAALERRPFSTLSGGEKQRVIIASALAQLGGPDAAPTEPAGFRALLLDEPTASLDVGYQLEIAALVAALNREAGIAVVLSTHDLNLAASLCRHLVLLGAGRALAAGPTEQVLTAENVRRLYGVDAEIGPHPRLDRLLVLPWRRIATTSSDCAGAAPRS